MSEPKRKDGSPMNDGINNNTYNLLFGDYDNLPKEEQILALLEKEGNVEGTYLNNFLKKYLLTPIDFMILAKTAVNYQYIKCEGFERTDLKEDLVRILKLNNLYESYEFIQAYRRKLNEVNSEGEKPKRLVKKFI